MKRRSSPKKNIFLSSALIFFYFSHLHLKFTIYLLQDFEHFLCVSCIYRGKASEVDTCREQQNSGPKKWPKIFSTGEKSHGDGLGWILAPAISINHDLWDGQAEDFCHDLRFPWTFPRERHVRALCTCKVLETKDVENMRNIFFSALYRCIIYACVSCVHACVYVCMYRLNIFYVKKI